MAQGKSPRSPLAFASVLYPGRCLASQPILLGSEVEEGQQFKRADRAVGPTRSCLRAGGSLLEQHFVERAAGPLAGQVA